MFKEIKADQKRREAFENGDYKLSEDEGFFCENCNWRGLTAPMSDYSPEEIAYEDKPACKCPLCGGKALTKKSDTDYLEPFMEE